MPGSVTNAVHDWEWEKNTAASRDLDRRFRAHLLALVRRRRSPDLEPIIDSEGVVQEALKSFFSGVAKHKFPDLNSRKDVKNLLITFVLRNLIDETRAQRAGKRNAEREENYARGQPDHLADTANPTAEQVAEAHECLEKLPEVVRPVHEKAIQILELGLEGLRNNEIADRLDLSLRTVQKIKHDMWAAVEKAHSEEHSDG